MPNRAPERELLLAGDIGGTKCHLALCSINGAIAFEQRYPSRDYARFDILASDFLSAAVFALGEEARPRVAAFAVAGPVHDDVCHTTNLPWRIDARELETTLAVPRARLVNDFTAQALSLDGLGEGERARLHGGERVSGGPCAILGAGTGLGEAVRVETPAGPIILPSEGGHADFAPVDERQVALWRALCVQHGHVSYERVLSGAGLVAIHKFLCESGRGAAPPEVVEAMRQGDPAAVISEWALSNRDATCADALELFCELYGQEAGNLALKVLPSGGVYLCGGIAPKILPRLQGGAFERGYLNKGRMAGLVARFPVFVVTHPASGLLGAAMAARALR